MQADGADLLKKGLLLLLVDRWVVVWVFVRSASRSSIMVRFNIEMSWRRLAGWMEGRLVRVERIIIESTFRSTENGKPVTQYLTCNEQILRWVGEVAVIW